jgi:mannose-1-phosphate guanylyltransferase
VLLPLVRIAERDSDAVVVMLPADHYLSDEDVMIQSLREAVVYASADRDAVYLLGIEPDEADTELGYILPAQPAMTAPWPPLVIYLNAHDIYLSHNAMAC